MSVTSVAIQFTIIDLLSKGVEGIKNRMQSLAGANREAQRSFDRMAQAGKIAAMSLVATRELARGLTPAVMMAGDLQAELLGVRAELMGAGKNASKLAEELAAIKSTAFSVQAWTPFDETQIVALEKALIKAGAAVEDVVGKTGAAAATAALAVYEKLDPVRTGEALIGIGTPFKIAADQYVTLADTISRAASASTVGAAEIAETAKYAAGSMAQLGKSNKEMLALAAVMAQVGITGSMAGTSLKNFFIEAAKHKQFWDAKGDLLPTVEIIEKLRNKLKGLGEAQKSNVLKKLFGEQGMPVALALLNEGKGSFAEINRAMESGISLQEKLKVSMEGFNKQLQSLRGTSKSVIADLFQPALAPLTAIVAKVNELVSALGEAGQKNEGIGKAVSGVSFGALGAGAAVSVLAGGAALYYGRKVLKGVGGVKGLFGSAASATAGIAAGKVVEAAAGVTPVFVTNWPAGGVLGETAAVAATTLAGSKAGKILPWLKGLLPMAGKAGLVAAAGVAGYGVGTVLNKISGYMAGVMSGGKYGGEGWLGSLIFDLFNSRPEPEVKNDITLNVAIDPDRGQVQSDTNDMNTRANINLKRGKF